MLIGVVLYIGFLAWFFWGIKPGMDTKWSPSSMYNEVGDCSSTTTSTPPAADQVFDAKTAVPMKSVTARRRSFRARRSSSRSVMAMARSSYSRLLSPNASSYRFSSSGVIHRLSSDLLEQRV